MRSLLFAAAAAIATASCLFGQTGVNLLGNPSFETGVLAPWVPIAGSTAIASYGLPSMPSVGVSSTVLGGNLLARDSSGSSAIEQIVTPSTMSPGWSLVVNGFCGGGPEDDARIVVRFLNAAGTQIDMVQSDYATAANRNFENVLLFRQVVRTVPLGAVSFAVRIEFRNIGCCGGQNGAADNFSATLETSAPIPASWPAGFELLSNPGFEGGWAPGSPLVLIDPYGWEGVSGNSVVRSYSNSDPAVPSGLVSCRINGAYPSPSCGGGASGSLLGHAGGSASLRQLIDVRGNTTQFAATPTVLWVSAYLGGSLGEPDFVRVDFNCRSANLTLLGSGTLDPVTSVERNFETVLLLRESEIPIPASTAFLEFVVTFTDQTCCGGERAWIDNLSAQLRAPSTPSPVTLSSNLLLNAGLESGSLPGTPLVLSSTAGWRGVSGGQSQAVTYGGLDTPSPTFAVANGLGALLLQDGGNSVLRQSVDLRGAGSLIGAGHLAFQASAWLGGYLTEPDTAEVRIRFYDAFGIPVGLPQTIPAVTAADRTNQTRLLYRATPVFLAPPAATRVDLEVVFVDLTCCGGARGLADDVRLVAFNTLAQGAGVAYPGTDPQALQLATGVNQPPQGGLGYTTKQAGGGQILQTRVVSPNATLDGAPLLLAVSAFVTGTPQVAALPDIWINPGAAIFLYNGWSGRILSPVVIPAIYGGNVYSVTIPAGLAGVSLMLQGIALAPASAPSPNGIYLATDGHEIQLQ